MLARLRQSILLYVLILVVAGAWVTQSRTRSWEHTLWVEIHPIAASENVQVSDFLAKLELKHFQAMEDYLNDQANNFDIDLARPARIVLGPQLHSLPPTLPTQGSYFAVVLWSLKMRWWAMTMTWSLEGPQPDVRLFAIFHDPDATVPLERSVALQKGMVAIANLFAEQRMQGSNLVVATHELLHTLGATDKYDLATNLPIYPHGYAEPQRKPRYPQRTAEIMAGRVPLTETQAAIPLALRYTRIGPMTATEIGWQK
jgi:hypothetical protein